MGPHRALRFFVLVLTLTQCGPRTSPTSLPAQADVPRQAKTLITPPSWVARFSKPTELRNCVKLAGDSRLCVGAIGERWLDEPSGALASAYLAPETLVAALPTGAQSWVLVGQHGSRFTAQTPLGPLVLVQRPPQRYTKFTVAAGRWYGLTVNGELWQGLYNDLVGARANLPEPIFDFAMSPAGNGLALSIPEQAWASRDSGANWETLQLGPFGATSIAVDERGDFGITTLLPGPAKALEGITFRSAATALSQSIKLRHAPAEFAETQGFVEGRSARLGPEVLELRKIEETWQAGVGPIDKPLSFSKVTGLDDCSALHVAVSAKTCLVICRNDNEKAGTRGLSLRESDIKALNFTRLPGLLAGRFDDIQIATVHPNHFIATGLCAASASQRVVEPNTTRALLNSKNIADCVPHSVVSIELSRAPTNAGPAFTLRPVMAAGAHFAAPPVAVSRNGQLAAFVARSGSTTPWQLYFQPIQANRSAPVRLTACQLRALLRHWVGASQIDAMRA